MAKIKAAVIFGGISREHDLSLASAADVIRSIPKDKYEIISIGITKKGRWLYFPGLPEEIENGSWETNPDCTSAILSPDPLHHGVIIMENGEASVRKLDVVFPVLQGKFGADGSVQGLLDMAGIPYVGSGLLSSASCMDKSHTYMVLDDYDVPIPKWALLTQRDISNIDEKCRDVTRSLKFPMAVRPANSGCSAGSGIAEDLHDLVAAVKVAFSNDNKVVVEEHFSGRKLFVAVYGYDMPVASEIGEVVSTDRVYDPTEARKSTDDDAIIPFNFPKEGINIIKSHAVAAFKALGCKGLARVDFILTEDNGNYDIVLNKISTAPGLRLNSVYPKLMAEMGMDMEELVDGLLEQAMDNAERSY